MEKVKSPTFTEEQKLGMLYCPKCGTKWDGIKCLNPNCPSNKPLHGKLKCDKIIPPQKPKPDRGIIPPKQPNKPPQTEKKEKRKILLD
ncbi:hypothetical protein [Dysgonomonas termitidis]|uniref:Uncharacterized protein n=1 Tax=Dysgonomonas termitidis TaxID=1516126 RepID=A0ABV9KXK7_9BACT